MTTTIKITSSELIREEFDAQKKLSGLRFPLEDKIKDYFPKKDGQLVFQDFKTFVALQELVYEKLSYSKSDDIFVGVSHHLAGLVTLDSLVSVSTSQCEAFSNHKVDYGQEHPLSINNCLNLYLTAMDDARPRSALENLTHAFFNWVVQSSAQELVGRKVDTKIQDYSLSFNDKIYSPKLKYTKGAQKVGFDISKYDVSGKNHALGKNDASARNSGSSLKNNEVVNGGVSSQDRVIGENGAVGEKKTGGAVGASVSVLGNRSKGGSKEMSGASSGEAMGRVVMSDAYIHGHDEFKMEFKKIAMIVRNRDYLSSLFSPRKLFQNYLLLGPPGTGKTTMVSTLAKECGLKFYTIPCVTLGSEYFSRSAANLNDVYAQAVREVEEKKEPGVILFFDEFDHIAKRRGYGNSSESDSLITTLNENLDGSSSRAGIITFAASNVEDMLDTAVVSRFRRFYIGYPQDDVALEGIHSVVIRKLETYAGRSLFEKIDYSEILSFAHNDERYKSGRIIDRILTNAALNKVIDGLNNGEFPSGGVRGSASGTDRSFTLVTSADLALEYARFNMESEQKINGSQKSLSSELGSVSRTR